VLTYSAFLDQLTAELQAAYAAGIAGDQRGGGVARALRVGAGEEERAPVYARSRTNLFDVATRRVGNRPRRLQAKRDL
jgi:hypothetical protein